MDKVMVNKQAAINRVGNSLGCWEAENGNLSDALYQKYLQDSSNMYPEQSYNMFMGSNRFNMACSYDIDDVDAATTSDSSETDLLWEFNRSKLSSITNGMESNTKEPTLKSARSPELSKSLYPMSGPSPSRKLANGVGQQLNRNGSQPTASDGKHKTGGRK
ncbi:hypothetical protein F3Y22_tig00110607pilonHSYRG00078 [Hibiscus syriacus]|uniref:Uncharacterized protein n=1 Tax=Hibiscus syriacus TaxID=106335 RepID=A0A6A3A0V4_HIBSY|nr:hypothetical protein F3Y22_tig00110607pilonHSYRG00078 [Hibiscus syriacus]